MLRKMRLHLIVVLVWVLVGACSAATTTGTKTETIAARPDAHPRPRSPDLTPAARHVAVVSRVVDGDTARVRYHRRDVTIRFIGVDTPETVAHGQPVECYGPEASAFTTKQLSGSACA